MGLLTRKRLIMVKRETTYGTDPTPSASTDSLLVRNINPTPINLTYANRDIIRAFLGASDQLPSNAYAMIEFEVEMTGGSALGVPVPAVSALLRACAFAESITASTSVVYTPVSTGFDSCTIYFNSDGVLQKLTGARGTVVAALSNHEVPVWRFQFIGRFNALTDTAQGTPDYSAFKTPVPVNNVNTTSLSIHSFTSAILSSIEADVANTLVFRSLVGGTDQVMITDRAGRGSLSIEMTTVTAKDWLTAIRNATTGAISLVHGPAGNRVTLALAKTQLTNPRLEDQEGIQMLSMDLQMLPSSGNDELTITLH